MNQTIRIKDYSYNLPQDRIALFPLEQRDHSRLLVYRGGAIQHDRFYNISKHLPAQSLLFFNNTRVIQARLPFHKETGAAIEIFLLHPVAPSPLLIDAMQATGSCRWVCTIGNVRRWKEGQLLKNETTGITLVAALAERDKNIVEFTWEGDYSFAEVVANIGRTPLPPYLQRDVTPADKERYQTIYSKNDGAVAAPTAGLHFTEDVFRSLTDSGCTTDFLTLHVSAGTFQPVKAENAADHAMHEEQVVVSRANLENILKHTGKIIPVGTTSMRTLESIYWYGVKLIGGNGNEFTLGQRDPYTWQQDVSRADAVKAVLEEMQRLGKDTITGETSIYIMPGYRFRLCDGLITNFHQPESTLILLVAALIGPDWRKVYDEALDNGYRFLSYGDSSLLLN